MSKAEESEIEDLLKSIPSEFRVIESRISLESIDEYYEIAGNLTESNRADIIKNQDKWAESKSLKDIKELLVCLSAIGDVDSYRKIEKITRDCKLEMGDFSFVVLQLCRLNLENSLSDDSIGFISSELGAKGNMLRYYFVVWSKDGIGKGSESKVANELRSICDRSDSELEEIENQGNYLLVKILVSIDYAIGNIIEELISKCVPLEAEYICTNVEKPTAKFIEEWMNT